MPRKLISSGSQFETAYGYSRAVVDGEWVFVSGTTGFNYKTMTIVEDAGAQTEQCFANLKAVLAEAGSSLADIVRVRYLIVDGADLPKCQPVIERHLGAIRPAATMMVVGLLDPRMKIEIEITARRTT
jgi:enamine deaminase RidA (YjgF/YER057c/UK114 family)